MPRNELDNPFEAIVNLIIEGIEVLVMEVRVFAEVNAARKKFAKDFISCSTPPPL